MESQAQPRSPTNHCRDLPAISVGKAACPADSEDPVTLDRSSPGPNFELLLERSSTLHALFETPPTEGSRRARTGHISARKGVVSSESIP